MSVTHVGRGDLEARLGEARRGHVVVGHVGVPGYAGMVRYVGFAYDVDRAQFDLNVEWMALGLDLYGDTLHESRTVRFTSLDALLASLHARFGLDVTDIPLRYRFDPSAFPDPIKDEARRAEFEEAWARFRVDFAAGRIAGSWP